MTINLGSHFAIFAGITSDNVDWGVDTQLGKSLWAWITSDNVVDQDTQLGKSLCNFAGITSDNVDPGGWGDQLTLNLGSHFATLLGLPLTMRICGGGSWGGFNRHSTWEVTLQLCWDYL